MKKLLIALSIISGLASASNLDDMLEPGIVIKNVHGVLESGTWFNLSLLTNVNASLGTQNFTARLNEPIYNQNFEELLIPANSIATGTYSNSGESCSFNVTQIQFDNQRVELLASNYTKISLPLPAMLTCDPKKNYLQTQIMDFKSNKDIEIAPLSYNKMNLVAVTNNTFVQTFGKNDRYVITKIINFTNGLMEVTVKFNEPEYINRFIPVFYDNYEIPHPINFTKHLINDGSEVSYIFTSRYSKFGFALIGK